MALQFALLEEDRFGGKPKSTRETSALPRFSHRIEMTCTVPKTSPAPGLRMRRRRAR